MAKLILHLGEGRNHREIAEVVLSEKNLLTLLTKLYTPGSQVAIQNNRIEGEEEPLPPDYYFTVRAEPDHVHYDDPGRHGAGPGAMHPLTELMLQFMRALRDGVLEEDNEGNKVFYIDKEEYERYQKGV